MIHFGNPDGQIPTISNRPLTKETRPLTPMSLGKFLSHFKFYGSISYKGRRKEFKKFLDGWQVHNKEKDVEKNEDYCAFCLDDTNVTPNFADLGLLMLDCGEGHYLEYKPNGIGTIAGHSGGNATEDTKKPLRISSGHEIKVEQKDLERVRLHFDYDSTPGNSGSPVCGRGELGPNGDEQQAYRVKGIHVCAKKDAYNCAQKITNLPKWLNYGK